MIKKPQILSINHPKGGVGKSTVAYNLIPLFEPDYILDIDNQKSTLAAAKRNHTDETLSKKIIRVTTIDEVKAVFTKVRQNNLTLLVDCGGYDADISRFACVFSDAVLVPTTEGQKEADGIIEFHKTVQELKKDFPEQTIKPMVFLNKVAHNKKHFGDVYSMFDEVFPTMIKMESKLRQYKVYDNCDRNGRYVIEDEPYHDATRQLKALYAELLEIFNREQ